MKAKGNPAKNGIILFVISNKDYDSKIRDIVSSASSHYNRVCYVSLNKPYSTVLASLRKYGIDTRKFFFVECTGSSDKNSQAVSVSSPKALTEMSITISKVLELGRIEALIFDSLSTLLVYEQPSTVVKFTHSLISMLRAKKASGFLTCLESSASSEILKDISMFADSVVK